jgi:hypothetical protein
VQQVIHRHVHQAEEQQQAGKDAEFKAFKYHVFLSGGKGRYG